MIICSNCGATNNENSGRICRKCGALLPVSSRPPRIRMSSNKSKKEKKKTIDPSKKNIQEIPKKSGKNQSINGVPREAQFFSPKKKQKLDLQEIPKEEIILDEPKIEITDTLNETNVTLEKIDLNNKPSKNSAQIVQSKSKRLQEIPPEPFKGSLISSKEAYGSKKKSKNLPKVKSLTSISNTNISSKADSSNNHFDIKRKKFEDDMYEVLTVLSKKLKVPEREKSKSVKDKEPKPKIHPANMNEILIQLLSVDLHIEASAILKGDKIIASAISSRISETLFATIGQNLAMIGGDIIEGLNAGSLSSISVRGTQGVLDLAPIDITSPSMENMILIIFSHPKIKSGIISFATNIVKKQIKEYLENEKK